MLLFSDLLIWLNLYDDQIACQCWCRQSANTQHTKLKSGASNLHGAGASNLQDNTYDGLKKARKRERYEEENRADLALFAAAGRYFQERGMTKFPDLAKIKAENQSLVSRKNAIYSEYLERKTKTAELRRVKTNLDAMLRQEYKPQRRQEQER